jgi:hypothetical protein
MMDLMSRELAAGATPPTANAADEVTRAIEEADVVHLDGDLLYVLSRYAGLAVVKLGPDDGLRLLGRYQVSGQPFEMVKRGNVAYAMFTSFGSYAIDAATSQWSWVQTSRVEALDVSDPSSIRKLGSFEVQGSISDSRVVGDVMYVVSHEEGSCWDCADAPRTEIMSLSIADPRSIHVVDRLNYQDTWGWRKSVSVTPRRMYVAGVEWDGTGDGHSTIQVVDISDPSGRLVAGASVQVAGQIESRWQMDEHDDVLRVISQPGSWSDESVPVVQTFKVESAQSLGALGSLDLELPRPERLRAVRFDGTRAYAITAEQTDPLFTIDLATPMFPRQAGELEMPGWIFHMEPRGTRLLAVGFDTADAAGSLHVSLFDVANADRPTMLQRVPFGGKWASLGEDQDRIQKSFRVFDRLGMIAVPFGGYHEDAGGCGSYVSGIQLIDMTGDQLTRRGIARTRGEARRAVVSGERLLAVSDEGVRGFDIGNRDAPRSVADVSLSTQVDQAVVVGERIARLGIDPWSSAARLEIVPASDPRRLEPTGSLDLTAALDPQGDACASGFWGARMFAIDGGHLAFVWPSGSEDTARLAVIDVSDGARPQIAARLDLPFGMSFYMPYGWGVAEVGDPLVQLDKTLVFLRSDIGADDDERAWVETVDLSDPRHPVRGAPVALPAGRGRTGLVRAGDIVVTSHWEPLGGDDDRVRFYLDRVSVASPRSPRALASVNVPGSLIAFDGGAQRLLTLDFETVSAPARTWEDCYAVLGDSAVFAPRTETSPGGCSGQERSFKLVHVEGSVASLLDTLDLEGGWIGRVRTGGDRVFVSASSPYYILEDVAMSRLASSGDLIVLGGLREGPLDMEKLASDKLQGLEAVATIGEELILTGGSPPAIWAVDATRLHALSLEKKGEVLSYPYGVTLDGQRAVCAMGPYGLDVVDLR